MAKLEGISPAAKMPGHRFSLDIGGYKAGENSTRKIQLKNLSPNAAQIIIAADVLKMV